MGIQARMLLLMFALGSLFLVYVAVNTSRQADRDIDDVREQLRLVAALAGARLDDHIGDVTQFLNALSGTLGTERGASASNDAVLQSLAPQMPANLVAVSLWAADGTNIGSSDILPEGPRSNVADRSFFRDAMRPSGLAAEAPVRLLKGGEWTAEFALPIVREGRTIAVISASSRLMAMPQLLSPTHDLPEGAEVSIIDADGRFLARSRDADRWIGQAGPLDRPHVQKRLAERTGSAEVTSVDGMARIVGFARTRSVPWLVYVGMPASTALAAASANTRRSLLLALSMLAGGVFVAALVAGRIAGPLRQLSADARLLGEGHFEHRSAVRTGSEVGLLAATFNRMAQTLEERIAAGKRSEERLSLALEGSEQALFDWDIGRGRIYFSAKAAELRGEPAIAGELTPEQMRAHIHPEDLAAVMACIEETMQGRLAVYEAEYRILRKNGTWLWIRSRGRVVERDVNGSALRLVGTDADISRRKAAEDELRQRAEFDALTGLPNRALFNDRIAGALARAARSGKGLGLLFVDIDHLKAVNDTRGHAAGDDVLKIAAQRLSAAVRSTDTVARLGGDEFTVILEGLGTLADAEAVAAKVVEAIRVPVPTGTSFVQVSTSVGLAMLLAGAGDAATLLRRADEALYEAKRRGRDRYAVHRMTAAA
jgi:diguanylate cyclase (GGDEF)-like protein/PAS domain S-box-containing protein